MMPEIDTVKGFQDYLPSESLKRRKIKQTAEKWFSLYGFLPVETPVIEYDELMKGNSLPTEQEDEAVSDRFRLKDRGGRNLGLRYEFTFQLARVMKQNPNIKLPFKKYQIGENFRDEPLRAGRTRQFTQCDADIIGDSSISADAECIAVISDILKDLNINDFEIRINNRKLLNAIIESVEIRERKQVMKEIDKLDKIGEDNVKANLRKYADSNQIITLFKLLEKPLEFFKENKFDGIDELIELEIKCKMNGIKVKPNLYMVRGFGYYTGNVFEFFTKEKNALVGGGRYDKSVGKFTGKDIPAVGISFSIEALMALCKEEIDKIELTPTAKITLISIKQDKAIIALAKKLRKENISCITSFGGAGKALEYANAYQIPFALFIGEDEVKNKKFKLKDMKTGNEREIVEKTLISFLKKL